MIVARLHAEQTEKPWRETGPPSATEPVPAGFNEYDETPPLELRAVCNGDRNSTRSGRRNSARCAWHSGARTERRCGAHQSQLELRLLARPARLLARGQRRARLCRRAVASAARYLIKAVLKAALKLMQS